MAEETNQPSDGDERDELVPLNELRPSREVFGPLPSPGSKRPAARPTPPARQRQTSDEGASKAPQRALPPARSPQARPGSPAADSAGLAGSVAGDPGHSLRQGPAVVNREPVSGRRPKADPKAEKSQAEKSPETKAKPAGAQKLVKPVKEAKPVSQGKAAKPVKAAKDVSQGKSAGSLPAVRTASAPARRGSAQPVNRDNTFARRLEAKEASDKAAIALRPHSGWRSAVLKVSGGVINLGPSAQERAELQRRSALRRPIVDGTVAVFSRKGGVGKTTISAYLGLTLAVERGGRVVALDGDAEAGSLGWLLAPNAPSTLAELASADPMPGDYRSLRRYTTATPEGLEVIVGDPAEMGPISTIGLEALAGQLSRHYDLSIFDTGAGVTRATGRVLVNSARVLLLVMGPSVDSVRAAERTLSWLDERPGEVAHPDVPIIAVINGIPAKAKAAHIDKIESHFAHQCEAVVRIPWDAHLAAGSSVVALDRLAQSTRSAFLELAATTVTTLSRSSRRPAQTGARHAS